MLFYGAKKTIVIVKSFVMAAALLFLFLMPRVIMPRLEENAYDELFKSELPQENFVLTLWHIVEFKPYTGSLGSFFINCAARFEKEHDGVFIECSAITLEEYNERISRGEKADIYSFPERLNEELQLKTVEYAEREPLFDIAYDGSCMAAYALSGKFLVGNVELMQKQGVDFENENAAELTAQASSDTDSFKSGKEMLAVVDAGTLGSIERNYKNGKGFKTEAVPINSVDGLIQYIGISETVENEKAEAALEFINGVFSPENAEKLCDMGLIPFWKTEGVEYEFKNSCIDALYQRLKK